MSKNCPLISITLLFILAVGGTAFAQGDGDRFVLDSLKWLLAINTVECEIRIETFVDGREYSAKGRYAEQALPRVAPGQPAPFLRSMYWLEIYFVNALMASNAEYNRMTLVCHPATNEERSQIKRYTIIEGAKSFLTIDLARLEERLRETNNELFFTHVSEVRNLGGLAGIIRQINRFYEFSPPVQENLSVGETIPTWKLTGQLRNVFHKDLLPRFGGLDKRGHYPANFPSDIEIWLGRHDYFPYQIRYLRRISEQSEQKVLLFQESFFNVVLNGTPIPASKFVLVPPEDVFSVDDTDNVLRELGVLQ